VLGGRPCQHRAHQARLKIGEQLHGRKCRAALGGQGLAVFCATEQAVVFGERVLDLRILRQHRTVGYAESLGGFALGGEEIADAVLRHDARRFLRQRAAQILSAWGQLLHG
jgi:hypothetical protein